MKVFVTMCFALLALAAAKPAYHYQQPQAVQQTVVSSVSGPSASGFVSGPVLGPVSGPASGFVSNTGSGFVSNTGSGFVSGTGSGLVSGQSAGFVSGPAAGAVFSTAPQFGVQQVGVGGFAPQYAQQFVSTSGPQFVGPAPQYVAPVQQTTVLTPLSSTFASSPQYYAQGQQEQQVIINKDIFIHSAPEETEEINADQGPDQLGPIRKNYRVVFIKAPSHNIKLNVNSLKRVQAANEEKTVVYVLSKKPDLSILQNQLTEVQKEQKTHKPEVYFIKYKTQEEANRAQQEIQAQYDALGGSTHISDEGFAPVTSVIGGLSVNGGSTGSVVSSGGPAFSGGAVSGPTFTSGAVGGTTLSGGSSYTTGAVGGSTFSSGPSFSSGSVGGTSSSVVGGSTVSSSTSYTTSGVSGSSFTSGPVSSSQQTFVQQGPSSTVSFGAAAPLNKYLPASKKK